MKVHVTYGNPDERVLVLSENYLLFRSWCQDHGVKQMAPNIVFICRADQLQGRHGDWYAVAGDVSPEMLTLARHNELRDVT